MEFQVVSNIKVGDSYPDDGHSCSICGNTNIETLAVIKPKYYNKQFNLCKTCAENAIDNMNKRIIENIKNYKK